MTKSGNVASHTNVDQCGVERYLARSGGQQVFTAQNMGDPHQGIIHGVHKRVQRLPAGANQHKVGGRGGGKKYFAPHQVVKSPIQIGNPQPQRWFPTFVEERLTLFLA